MIGYSLGSSPEVICVAAIIGAIATRSMFTNIPTTEKGFEFFRIEDVEKFSSLGYIDNVSMFAHRCCVLSKQELCSYLRDMDKEEYDWIKSDHETTIDIHLTIKAPALIGSGVGVGISLAASILEIATFMGALPFGGGLGLSAGLGRWVYKLNNTRTLMERDRASRLDSKIIKLSARIEALKNCPREKYQLQIAKGYFIRTLAKHTNKVQIVQPL